ncbi:MAG: GTP-binding protein, partial [Acidimicrobiales bacterium]
TKSVPIAVNVIGGSLGAGKTTLLNHILRSADERIVVIVNDFGDINIDADLIERQDGNTISLTNGCICCSITDGFAVALEEVRQLMPRPERLVIEASGVADPRLVAAHGHSVDFRMESIIVVVDAATVEQKSRDRYVGDTVTRQLAAADIIVLNKTDRVSAVEVAGVTEWLRQRAAGVALLPASQAKVPLAALFDGQDLRKEVEEVTSSHTANDVFESWSWHGKSPVAQKDIERLMADLPDTIVRAKGILQVGDPAESMIVQRVGRRWTMELSTSNVAKDSRFVAIGLAGALSAGWLGERLDGGEPSA